MHTILQHVTTQRNPRSKILLKSKWHFNTIVLFTPIQLCFIRPACRDTLFPLNMNKTTRAKCQPTFVEKLQSLKQNWVAWSFLMRKSNVITAMQPGTTAAAKGWAGDRFPCWELYGFLSVYTLLLIKQGQEKAFILAKQDFQSHVYTIQLPTVWSLHKNRTLC